MRRLQRAADAPERHYQAAPRVPGGHQLVGPGQCGGPVPPGRWHRHHGCSLRHGPGQLHRRPTGHVCACVCMRLLAAQARPSMPPPSPKRPPPKRSPYPRALLYMTAGGGRPNAPAARVHAEPAQQRRRPQVHDQQRGLVPRWAGGEGGRAPLCVCGEALPCPVCAARCIRAQADARAAGPSHTHTHTPLCPPYMMWPGS